MTRARDEVERVLRFHATGQSAAAELLNMAPIDRPTAAQARRVDSLVAAAWGSTASYDAPVGAVESLFDAVALNLVADTDLAYELTAFPALLADLGREQLMLQAAADELRALMGARGVDTSLFDLDWFDVPWETGPANTVVLLGSPQFRGLVSMMWIKYRNTTGNLAQIRDAITRVEALLPAR